MSSKEQSELRALTIWLQTFPVVRKAGGGPSQRGDSKTSIDLSSPAVASAILEVAGSICGSDENEGSYVSSLQGHSGDVWDTIFTLTQRRKSKKRLLPTQDIPHTWSHAVQHATLAALLDAAVGHPVIEQRKEYIERIMGLSSDVQRALMSLIERRKTSKTSKTPKKTAKSPSHTGMRDKGKETRTSVGDSNPLTSPNRPALSTSRNNETPPSVTSPTGERRVFPRRRYEEAFPTTPDQNPSKRQSPMRARPPPTSFQSPGLGDTAFIEQEYQAIREQTIQLQDELAKKEKREKEMQEQLERSEIIFRQQLMKVEAEASRRHEDTRADYQRQLTDVRAQLTKMQEQHQKASQAQSQLALVQDDQELLRHTQQQLVETQGRLATYREKVQMLSDVKEALKREEEAHSKSVQECLELRSSLQNLQPLQRQLEDYKARATEAEVQLVETQDTLRKVQENGLLGGSASTDMERICQAQQDEIMELRLRLEQERSARGNDPTFVVGEGLTELNPELKEEVLRLRDENARLSAFRDSREDDAVSKLQQELEDASRLAERYKTQYLTTREQLEHKHCQLTTSKNREAKFRTEVQEGMEKLKASQQAVEEGSQELYRTQQDLMASRNKEADLEAELAKWIESAEQLQEKSNISTRELRTRVNQLEECVSREAKLIQDVAELNKELLAERDKHGETRRDLSSTQGVVESTERQASDLRDQLDRWIAKAQQLEDRIATLNGNVDTGKAMLVQARGREDHLTMQLSQATQFLSEANTKCEGLVADLSQVREQLAERTAEVTKYQDREVNLKGDLSDLRKRAEDAEAMSQQQKEQNEKLREDALSKEHEFKDKETMLTKRANVADHKAQVLQTTLSDAVRSLNASRLCNDQNQEKLLKTSEELSVKNKMVEDWKKQAIAATDEVHNLQQEISQVQQALETLNGDLQFSQSLEECRGQDVQHARHIILLMEDTLEYEGNERRKVEEKLEMAQAEMAKMRDEHGTVEQQLSQQVDERTNQVEKFKEELFHAQQTLRAVQSSLNSSEHREKLNQLEIKKLHQLALSLEEALVTNKEALERQSAQAAQSVESTCQLLQAKAQQEIQDLESRLNLLLDEERRAKRESEESYQIQIKELKIAYKQKATELQTSFCKERNEECQSKELEMRKLRDNYEEELARLKKVADEAHSQLVAKGKGMLRDIKMKAKLEHDSLQTELHDLEQRLAQKQQENEEIIRQAKTKVAGYKKKLDFASSRITTLTNEADELENRIRSLERERFKMSEENDRYRRQIGGRGGPDSKLQVQFEQLQKEFKSAMEETRELRRKLKEKQDGYSSSGCGYMDSIGEVGDSRSYSRDAMNQSTLAQLRTEYEETIEALNDEKRELVMKSSAATTDVQKAEKRAWESEKENAQLKQVNTSLQLQVERLHQLMATLDDEGVLKPLPPSRRSNAKSNDRVPSHSWETSTQESCASTDDAVLDLKATLTESTGTLPPDRATVQLSHLPDDDSQIPETLKTTVLPSFVQFHSPKSAPPDGPPQCQQS